MGNFSITYNMPGGLKLYLCIIKVLVVFVNYDQIFHKSASNCFALVFGVITDTLVGTFVKNPIVI